MHYIPMVAGNHCLHPKMLGNTYSCFFTQIDANNEKWVSSGREATNLFDSFISEEIILWDLHNAEEINGMSPKRTHQASSQKLHPHHGYSQMYSHSTLTEQGIPAFSSLSGMDWDKRQGLNGIKTPKMAIGTKYDLQKHAAMKLPLICIFTYLISWKIWS